MYKYTIYCSEEQVHKALELGAPLKRIQTSGAVKYIETFLFVEKIRDYYIYVEIPTVEQMIGWLEEQEGIDDIFVAKSITTWYYDVCPTTTKSIRGSKFNSRKEATLAAIDAALEYLVDNKFLK